MTQDEINSNIAIIQQYASDCGIDPGVAVEQARVESSFNPNAQSKDPKTGAPLARGLMQFTESTWSDYGVGDWSNAFDIYANLDAWCAYMNDLLNMFGGDYTKALQAYNGGPAHVQNGTVSSDAIAYASRIAAKYSGGGNGAGAGAGTGSGDYLPYLIIALVGLGVVFYFRD